jgi:hypothetical protein
MAERLGDAPCAVRELTVGEYLEHEIWKADRRLAALRDLRDHLNGAFLKEGSSRFVSIFERGM